MFGKKVPSRMYSDTVFLGKVDLPPFWIEGQKSVEIILEGVS